MPSMNAYSKDLRLKTLAAIDWGIPRKEVQELFGISRSTIKRWLNRRRQTGGVETMKIPGRPALLRKLGARTHEAQLEAMEEALSKVTPAEAAGCFGHCGYQVEVQYL